MDDLTDLPTVRFTQRKDEYLYYSESLVDTSASSQMFNVTTGPLNGILEEQLPMRLDQVSWIVIV